MSRWQNWFTFGVVFSYFACMWAGFVYYGPKWSQEIIEEEAVKQTDLEAKNERYIRMLKMRVALQDLRKEEIKKILKQKAEKEALKNAAATE